MVVETLKTNLNAEFQWRKLRFQYFSKFASSVDLRLANQFFCFLVSKYPAKAEIPLF